MMISPFQNFSSAGVQFATAGYGGAAVPDAMYNHLQHHQHVGGGQLQSVYDAVQAVQAATAQHGVYSNAAGTVGQQSVPYRPAAEYGARQPLPPPPPLPPSPYMTPSRYYESPRPSTTAEPPNRKKPAVQPPSSSPSSSSVQYTRVQGGVPGGKTSLHAVIDYDDEEETLDYYEEYIHRGVTPIQGPIFLRNGSVPVVPLYGYQKVSNGSLLQIPVFWTALSFALGYEIGGDVIRGTPCIKRNHQLFCPTAGKSYPIDRIDRFIDENKALMKRMYGEFEMMENGPFPKAKSSTARKRRQDNGFSDNQSRSNKLPTKGQPPDSGRVDSCESKVEVVTPYWASNSVGKTRAIVNTEHFEQAIHQEVCTKTVTSRCSGDCGCEQKYKWHRLLAYDPDNDCKGIFMDWFLFPSCCVCRCDSMIPNNV